MRWTLALLAVAAIGFSGSASAQVNERYANSWDVQTPSGCRVVVNAGSVYGFDHPSATKATWSGKCGADGWADGEGELRVYFSEEGSDIYADHHGLIAKGFMQGAWKFATWERDASGEYVGSGIYNYLTFRDGCMATFEKQPVRSACNPLSGKRAFKSILTPFTPPPPKGTGF